MSEMEENGGTFGGWETLISSPNGLVSVEFPFKAEKADDSVVNNEEEVEESGVYNDASAALESSGKGKVRSRGSIAERRAEKCGFNASRINVARFRSTSNLSSPAAWSPYLTIPSGISPTAWLDSPIMLPSSQPSPTTGTLPFPPLNHESLMLNSARAAAVGERGGEIGSSFMFQPHKGPLFWPSISDLQNQPPLLSEFPAELLKEAATKTCTADLYSEVKVLTNTILNGNSSALQSCHFDNHVPPLREPIEGDDTEKHLLQEGYRKEAYPPTVRTSEDGYNWRKYGQKQVKGSEYPRSYYKCTHPSCQVKKKVERSHDGQITEIIYKGAHNHQIPHISQRIVLGSPTSFNDMSEIGEGNESRIKIEGGEVWRNIQLGCKDIRVGSDWRPDGLERSSSTSILTDISDPLSTTQGKSMGVLESVGSPELSSILGKRDGEDEDGATQGTLSPGDDGDDDKSELKRRKKESFLIETSLVSRGMREPRVVVQIESEVDILDDGYRWRKYGQKVVKGNPNPRSYYKCTSAGCSVRKHVERASDNLKAVITTYEGKHNHEVPAAKNRSHANVDVGNLPQAASNGNHPNLVLPRIVNVSKPEPQVQDLSLHFERKLGNEYTRPNLVGNFRSEMKFEACSMYQEEFIPFQNSMSFGSVPPVRLNFSMPLPMTIPGSANMVPVGGFGLNNQGNPFEQAESFLGGQHFRENNARFLKPKQEQDENIYDTRVCIADPANAPSSSMYCRVIPNFPS